jgi:hypothetical protein
MTASPSRYWIAAGALALAFLLQSFFASRIKSPTYDEPAHIGAGLSYVETGTIKANPQHPPLLKELSGLTLLAAGIRLPDVPAVDEMKTGAVGTEYVGGSALLTAAGPARVLFWARLPFILIATAAGLLLFAWGHQLMGDLAALCALFLYAVSPTILAHSYLVTTDVGLAAFTLLFFFALWNYLRYPSWARMVCCGVALGCALASKFSAVALPPIAALLMLASLRWPVPRLPGSPVAFWEAPRKSGKASAQPFGITLLRCSLAFLMICAVAAVVVEACYFFPSKVFAYVDGWRRVNADHNTNYFVVIAGQLGKHALDYFALVWALKEPLAALILVVLGAFALWRTKTVGVLAKLFLILPPMVLFAGYSVGADDFGIRYLIPVLPFAYLIGGLGLASLIERRALWSRAVAAVLCLWLVVGAVAIYPDHLAYFNEIACLPDNAGEITAAGGWRCGPLWFDDHNVDWGQGLVQLKTWLDAHAAGRPWDFAYFGSFPPTAYGLNGRLIDQNSLAIAMSPDPGLHVVSAHVVSSAPLLGERFAHGGGSWLRTTAPVAIVGHSLYVFDIPAK